MIPYFLAEICINIAGQSVLAYRQMPSSIYKAVNEEHQEQQGKTVKGSSCHK